LIFRTFVYTVVESLKGPEEEDCGHVLVKDIMTFLGHDFGRGRVIILK